MKLNKLIAGFIACCLISPTNCLAAKSKEEKERIEQQRLDQDLKNLGNQNYMLFEQSVYSLEQKGKKIIPYLIEILKDKNSEKPVKVNTIYVLGRIGQEAREAIPTMIPFLRDEDPDFRAVTSIALGKMGPEAKDAVYNLGQLLNDKDEWVRKSARAALKKIGNEKAQELLKNNKEKK